MEENANYTYTYKRSGKRFDGKQLLIAAAAILVFLVVAIVLGNAAGKSAAKRKADKEKEAVVQQTEATTEATTEEVETLPFRLGDYTVDTGANSINFRKSYTTDSDILLEIASGTKLTITDIYRDTAAETAGKEVVYWGQTSYNGYTGWVAMNYLKRAYSDTVFTPEDNTTAANAENPTSAQTSSKYNPGDYVVNTENVGLRFKKTPGLNGEVITVIPAGAGVTVTKIVEVEADDDVYRYWGEVQYEGSVGYVSMAYLKSVA